MIVALASAWLNAQATEAAQQRKLQRLKENSEAVMILAGRPGTTMMKLADDLAIAIDDPQGELRVVAMAGEGARGNVRDLILLRNVDLAITDLTILNEMKRSTEISQMLPREIAHVVTLFPDKLTILAHQSIGNIQDLEGRRIAVGMQGSSSAVHAARIFEALGMNVTTVNLATPDAAEALVAGRVDAFACFCLSDPGIYQRVMFEPQLHIMPIPFAPQLQADYLPSELVHREFPSFIGKKQSVETLAVPLALVTYNWERGTPRYRRVEKFVQRFLNNLGELRKEPRHHGWQLLQVSATAPDWPRFAAVSEWQADQKKEAIQEMRVAFSEFLDRWTPTETQPVARSQQTELFEEFLAWQSSSRQ